MLQPSVYLFGIEIQEPITVATDFLVTIICFYSYYKLKNTGPANRTTKFIKWYFILMGIATFFGGLFSHAFLYAFNEYYKIPGWFFSMFAIMLIERSAIIYSKNLIPQSLSKFFLKFNIIELIVIMAFTAYYLNFKYVEFHCVYGFIVVVFSFHFYTYLKTKDKASKIMLYVILSMLFAMLVFNYPIIIDKWFNEKDFAHVIMAVSSIILLKSALLMKKLPEIHD